MLAKSLLQATWWGNHPAASEQWGRNKHSNIQTNILPKSCHKAKRGWFKSREATTAVFPRGSSHGHHKKTPPKLCCRMQSAVLWGKELFMSTHKGCRRPVLAGNFKGSFPRTQPSSLTSGAPCEMGQGRLQGRVRNEDLHHQQGRKRGGEEVSPLPSAYSSFSHGK